MRISIVSDERFRLFNMLPFFVLTFPAFSSGMKGAQSANVCLEYLCNSHFPPQPQLWLASGINIGQTDSATCNICQSPRTDCLWKRLPSLSDDAFLFGGQFSSIPPPLRSDLENESHSVRQAVHAAQAGLCQWTVASWRQRSSWSMPVGPSPRSPQVLRCLPWATPFLLFS